MSKLTKFQRSQNAHFNLRMKHSNTPGKKGEVLHRYHNNILNMQKAKKRILSKNEKRKVFKTINARVYK